VYYIELEYEKHEKEVQTKNLIIYTKIMQTRLNRYKQFINNEFLPSIFWNKDYSLIDLSDNLRNKIQSKQFKRIIFTGMGCSAIVSDVIKGFFIGQKLPIYIDVINDSDFDFLADKKILEDETTLIIISSYSGYSKEPIIFYDKIKKMNKNVILLTSGGELAQIGKKDNISIIYWKLRNPDREYPLFHVPQYLSILLDIFFELGLTETNYAEEMEKVIELLKEEIDLKTTNEAREMANSIKDGEIILLASPKWHLSLLKLLCMHFNEIAMNPCHRNLFNEFTHSEVASLTNPNSKRSIIIFKDIKENKYITDKMDNLMNILSEEVMENKKINPIMIKMDGKDFFENFFRTLLFFHHVTYFLGAQNNVISRELISRSAGNPWYNRETINNEKLN